MLGKKLTWLGAFLKIVWLCFQPILMRWQGEESQNPLGLPGAGNAMEYLDEA